MQIKNEQMEKNTKRGKKNLHDQNIQNDGTWEGNIPRERYMLLNEINEIVKT